MLMIKVVGIGDKNEQNRHEQVLLVTNTYSPQQPSTTSI